jgi:hypothetical protein
MANIISKGTNFSEGDTVTAANLNNHVDNSSFVSGTGNTTDNASLEVHTDGYLQVKDGGITSAKLASDAISGNDTVVINNNNFTDNTINASKIVDGTITADKLASGVISSLGDITEGAVTSPVVIGSSGLGGGASTYKCGYSRVGRICYFSVDMTWTGGSSISSDKASITIGLPFASEIGQNLGFSPYIHDFTGILDCTINSSDRAIGIMDQTSTGTVRCSILGQNGQTLNTMKGTIIYRIDETVT